MILHQKRESSKEHEILVTSIETLLKINYNNKIMIKSKREWKSNSLINQRDYQGYENRLFNKINKKSWMIMCATDVRCTNPLIFVIIACMFSNFVQNVLPSEAKRSKINSNA